MEAVTTNLSQPTWHLLVPCLSVFISSSHLLSPSSVDEQASGGYCDSQGQTYCTSRICVEEKHGTMTLFTVTPIIPEMHLGLHVLIRIKKMNGKYQCTKQEYRSATNIQRMRIKHSVCMPSPESAVKLDFIWWNSLVSFFFICIILLYSKNN